MSSYTWEYIQNHPQETKRLLGMDYESLLLLTEYLLIWEKKQKEYGEKQTVRINQAGGGRKSKLSAENQILLTLIYLRHQPSFQLFGILFSVS